MSPTTTPAAARPLNGQDYKTLGLSALGGALEFYDFIIFVFFATVIGHLFFPPEMPDWLVMIQTFGIFAAGYLVRPLGGIVLAHYGDRYGRKRVFAFSILLMALSTLGMALMPTYATIGVAAPILLIILRMLQGAAIGGEVPGAWTFVAEHVPFRRVGLACGFLTSGLSFGIMLGSLIAFAIITEQVFQWPGMGLLFIQAVQFADIPVMAAYLCLISLIFVVINLGVDLLYFAVDPRLRVEGKAH